MNPVNVPSCATYLINHKSHLNRVYFDKDDNRFKSIALRERIVSIFRKSHYSDENRGTINDFINQISLNDLELDDKETLLKLFFYTLPKHNRVELDLTSNLQLVNFLTANIDFDKKNPIVNEQEPLVKPEEQELKHQLLWGRLKPLSPSEKGCSNSYIIQDTVNRLGIFKPYDGDSLGKNNKKLACFLKRAFVPLVPQRQIGSILDKQAYVSEKASFLISKNLLEAVQIYINDQNALELTDAQKQLLNSLQAQVDQGLVPYTDVVEMYVNGKRKKGSLQKWVEGAEEGYKFLGFKNKDYTKIKDKAPDDKHLRPELFELMVILEYLTGNCDCHGENWLVVTDEGTGESRIVKIDGGWSMNPNHPLAGALELKRQCLWRNLDMADVPLSEFGKFIINNLNENGIVEDLERLYEIHPENPEDLDENDIPKPDVDVDYRAEVHKNRILTMQDRLNVLRNFATPDDERTLRQLGNIRTQGQVLRAAYPEFLNDKPVSKQGRLSKAANRVIAKLRECSFARKRRKHRKITPESIVTMDNPPVYDLLDIDKKWNDNSAMLHVFIHGMNAHPSHWDKHLKLIAEANEEALLDDDNGYLIDTFTPFVRNKGHGTLEECTADIILQIQNYMAQHPGVPICLTGHANGGRLALYIEQELRKTQQMQPEGQRCPIRVTTIGAPLLGTKAPSKMRIFKYKMKRYHREVRKAFRYGSPPSRELLEGSNQPLGDLHRKFVSYASWQDRYVDVSSAIARVSPEDQEEEQEIHIYKRLAHHSLVDAVAAKNIADATAWMQDMKKNTV